MERVTVTEVSQVAEARRRAVAQSQEIGFDESSAGRVAIVVTELATNLVKYGIEGEILIGRYGDAKGTGLEILAVDRGEGFSDLVAALRDGHSTGGSAGSGLGAVRRLSHNFDIASRLGSGTVVLARLSATKAASGSRAVTTFGAVSVPLKGEIANGDAYAVRERADGWTVIVSDGLGHGPDAALASEAALAVFHRHQDEAPSAILTAIHAGLRHTRGGAVSVARYRRDKGDLVLAGIGNVAGVVVSGVATKRTVSLAGTAGHAARRIQEFEYPMRPEDLFVLCSDGIATGWSLDAHPGIAEAHPTLVAGLIYRDFAQVRDDATVLVMRGDGT